MSAPVLATSHNPDDPAALARAAHNRALAADLRERVASAALGGSSSIVSAMSRAASCCRGSGSNGCSIPARPSSN
jgi:hypothetical protein